MKKNLLTVLILALLLVNTILNTVMLISITGTNRKTAELVTNIATAMNLQLSVPGEEPEKPEISLADTVTYKLTGTMTFPLLTENVLDESGNVVSAGKQRYLVCEISLVMNKNGDGYDVYGETIADREDLIKDAINTVVTSHTESECRGNFEGLKQEILEAVQELFDSDFIYKISVSSVNYG